MRKACRRLRTFPTATMLLYIHVPFCRRRCGYCAFHSQALPAGRVPEVYLKTLLEEIRLWGGTHFDPDLVDVFLSIEREIERITF